MKHAMTARISTGHRTLEVDLARPMPISMSMRHGEHNPVAWYAEYPSIRPFEMDGFIGSVAQGGSVNTNDIQFNPHGNGTHTECIGHLTKEVHSIERYLTEYFFMSHVLTITPEVLAREESEFRQAGDQVIGKAAFENQVWSADTRALVIRTTPNTEDKLNRVYTGNNPAYVDPDCMAYLRERGIDHVLIDLPSVDRENDGGLMLAHRAFWFDGDAPRMHATITELIYVPDSIKDGSYLLNLMVAPFANDATPSKPTLYAILR